MSKRLMLVLVLAFVVGITCAAFAEVQNVKVSGDLSVLAIGRSNLNFDDDTDDDCADADGFASIARIRVDANLTDNVDATIRLINERIWSTTEAAGQSEDNLDVDLAYATVKNPFDLPSTLVLGRQNIKIGSGMIIGAPGTNQYAFQSNLPAWISDQSPRAAFDAIVSVWDFAPFTLIAGNVIVTEGDTLDGDDDAKVYVLNGAYNFGEENMSTILEGTFAYGDQDDTDMMDYGIRATLKPMDNLSLEGEYIYQDVDDTTEDQDTGDAIRFAASFGFPDVEWTPTLSADYHRFSEHWNPFHESLVPGELANLLFEQTNVQAIGLGVSAKPMEDLLLKARFANFKLVDESDDAAYPSNLAGSGIIYTVEPGEDDLGNEVDVGLVYDYTADVQLGLSYAIFMPGDWFDETNSDDASSLIGSMKVSF